MHNKKPAYKILAAALITALLVTLSATGITVRAERVFDVGCVKISLNCERGNVFLENEPASFRIELENPEDEAKELTLTCDTTGDTDESGNSDGSSFTQHQEETFTLSGNTRLTKGCEAELDDKYGLFDTTISISCDGQTINETTFSYSRVSGGAALFDSLGVQTHYGHTGNRDTDKLESADPLITAVGAGWIRDNCFWSETVTRGSGGTVNKRVPDYVDDAVNAACESGKKTLLICSNVNPLYDSGRFPTSDEAVAAYAEYCAYLADHFRGRIHALEIWNEPDLDNATNKTKDGAKVTPAQYANLLKAAYAAIKNTNPDITVIGGCIAQMNFTSNPGTFGYELLKIPGITEYMDAFSIHAYSQPYAYLPDSSSGAHPVRDFTAQTGLAEQLLSEASPTRRVPLWITEYGASDCGDTGSGYLNTDKGYIGFKAYDFRGSGHGQATALTRAMLASAASESIEKLFIYNFVEKTLNNPSEDKFGIVTADYKAKPAYLAVSYLASLMKNASPATAVNMPEKDGDLYTAYSFESDSGHVLALESAVRVTSDARSLGIRSMSRSTAFIKEIKYDVDENGTPYVEAEDAAVTSGTGAALTVHAYIGGTAEIYNMFGNRVSEGQSGNVCGLRAEPTYLILKKPEAEYLPQISVEQTDSVSVRVTVRNTEPEGNVTALATSRNIIGGPADAAVYIDQIKADENGSCEFSFDTDPGEIYRLSIYDGVTKHSDGIMNGDLEMEINYYTVGASGETPLEDLSVLKPGDTVKAVMNVSGDLPDGLSLYGAVSDGSGMLEDFDVCESGGETTLTAELTVSENTDLRSLRFFLWDGQNRPMMNAARVPSGR